MMILRRLRGAGIAIAALAILIGLVACGSPYLMGTTPSATPTPTVNGFAITYNLDGGTNSSANPASYVAADLPFVYKAPSKTGYAFGGWYSDAALTSSTTFIPSGSVIAKTVYAKWTAVSASNFAMGAWVTTSGTEAGYDLPGYYAVDGSNSTRWSSQSSPSASNPAWIALDFGTSRSFTAVGIYWEAAPSGTFAIQTSSDGSTWTAAPSASALATTSNGGTTTYTQSLSTRYLRIYATGTLGTAGVSIYEITLTSSSGFSPLSLTGTSSTFAGGTNLGFLDATTGTSARFNSPQGIVGDSTYLYIADTNNYRIRKVNIVTGDVTTLAGSGTQGSADGSATVATFVSPYAIASDGTNLYVTDGNKVRKVLIATGAVSSYAGLSTAGSTEGALSSASFNGPMGITYNNGYLYVGDTFNHCIRKIDMVAGTVSTMAGTKGLSAFANGNGTSASFNLPEGITTDGTNIYVADYGNHAIRKIVISSALVSTLAGSGSSGSTNASGSAASFNQPTGVATDGVYVYVADWQNARIRKIDISSGAVTNLYIGLYYPTYVYAGATSLFATVSSLSTSLIAKIQ